MGIHDNEETLPKKSSVKGKQAMREETRGTYVNPSRDPSLSHGERMAMRRFIKLQTRKSSASVLRLSEKETAWRNKERERAQLRG